jgi:hypothetical protein
LGDFFAIGLSAAAFGFSLYGIGLIVMVVRPTSRFAKRFGEVLLAEAPRQPKGPRQRQRVTEAAVRATEAPTTTATIPADAKRTSPSQGVDVCVRSAGSWRAGSRRATAASLRTNARSKERRLGRTRGAYLLA